jgi:pimeloyl-ACP methyl ester carboxylesterase
MDSRGAGPDVVVVPGFVTTGWTPALEALTDSYTLHLVQLPGFAGDTPPRGIRTPLDLACLVKAGLMARGLVGAPVVGHSVGGWVAAELAAITPTERLVLVNPLGLRIAGEQREDIFNRPREDVIDLVYADVSKAPVDWNAPGARNGYAGLARYGWNPYLCDGSLPNRLRVLDLPTLIVWGADDRVVPPTHADLFCELIRGARAVVIPEAGHDPMSDQPARWAEIVRDFIPSKEGRS